MLALLSLLLPLNALGATLCDFTWQDFQNKLLFPENRLAFTTSGGPMHVGLCWWHSRMTRNANYLLEFAPTQPRPGKKAAMKIIKGLTNSSKVMLVPGYNNLGEFSRVYAREMTETLGQWQLADSFLRMQWVKGLQSRKVSKPKDLKKQMDALYQRVQRHEVVYQLLQFPGFTAHAWLVIAMEPVPAEQGEAESGYRLTVVDSTFLNPQTFEYRYGMLELHYPYTGKFVPLTQNTKDMNKFQQAISASCKARRLPAAINGAK